MSQKYSVNSRLRDVVENPAAKQAAMSLINSYFPGVDVDKLLTENKLLYNLFSGRSVKSLLDMARSKAPGQVPANAEQLIDEALAKVE